LVLYIFKWICT